MAGCTDCDGQPYILSEAGNGVCSVCHGSGKIGLFGRMTDAVPLGHLTESDCDNCGGSGRCPTCGGTGSV